MLGRLVRLVEEHDQTIDVAIGPDIVDDRPRTAVRAAVQVKSGLSKAVESERWQMPPSTAASTKGRTLALLKHVHRDKESMW